MSQLNETRFKLCCTCKTNKDLLLFSKNKSAKDGYDHACKDCHHQKYLARKEYVCAKASTWKKENPLKRLENNRRWVELNKEKATLASREWARRNRAYGAAAVAKRRVLKRQATPLWANLFIIEEIYELAALRTKAFGFPWHVDHIIPLQGKLVCGLHVESNLRVIPAKENLQKGNKFVSS